MRRNEARTRATWCIIMVYAFSNRAGAAHSATAQRDGGTISEAQQSHRASWVDYARGLGIALVVLGHVNRGLVSSGLLRAEGWVETLDNALYVFHMPLFFALSGLFAMRAVRRPAKEFVGQKLRTIAYPYLVWSLVQSLVQLAVPQHVNHTMSVGDLWRIVYEPVMQFWFLWALFVAFMAVGAMHRLRMSLRAMLGFSLAVYVAAQWVSLGPWGIVYATVNHLPYFVLGALAAPLLLGERNDSGARLFAVAALGFALVGVAALYRVTQIPLCRPPLGMAGMAACVAVSFWMARSRGTAFVASLGRRSLEIYLMHTLASAAVRVVLSRVLGIDSIAVHIVVGTVAGLLLPLLGVAVVERLRLRYIFTWPQRPASA